MSIHDHAGSITPTLDSRAVLGVIAGVFLIVFLFALALPAVVGFVDATWWFYTDHTLSSIKWDEAHSFLAIVGVLISGGILGCLLV